MSATPAFRKQLWALIKPYWTSEEKKKAWALFAVIMALNLGEVYLVVQINEWNNQFFNSLQNKDWNGFEHALIRFSYLALGYVLAIVYEIYLTQMLQINWRRWMTECYLKRWLKHQNYYRMQLTGEITDNPDQRVAEDIDQFIRISLSLVVGIINNLVTLFSFIGILWGLSGTLEFTSLGTVWHVYGYMVWAALLYSGIGTWLTYRIGAPLINLTFDQQHFEANFRFSLVRLRENTESIAFYKGEEQEKANFMARFRDIAENWRLIMRRERKLNWFTNIFGELAIVFPFFMAAPRYFAGKIQLGAMMQTVSAFNHMESALNFFVSNFYTSSSSAGIANWKAVTNRLRGFDESIEAAEAACLPAAGLVRMVSVEGEISARNLTVRLPDGRTLLSGINLKLGKGDSLLVAGLSGSGKSTLLRALAGLWPYLEGELRLPEESRMLFVPQKAYLPLGTLHQVLTYPDANDISDERLSEVLRLCHLAHLAEKLGQTEHWSNILSLGEQQRVAFARIFLSQPDFIFLDEATSALDEETEAHLYKALKEFLPQASLISVGHHASLRAWHTQSMTL